MQQPRRRHAVRGCCIASCAYGRSGVSPRLCHRGPRICGRSWCCFSFLNKARWGRDGGLGGKGKNSRASSDRRRPQAVPVATREATGIDSRDEGVPFPPTTFYFLHRPSWATTASAPRRAYSSTFLPSRAFSGSSSTGLLASSSRGCTP